MKYSADLNAAIREVLTEIAMRHGKLTPAAVVAAAADHDHPLHDHFEWDDSVAGQAYRIWQARVLIKAVRIIDPRSESETPVFVPVMVEKENYYQLADVAATNVDEWASAVDTMTHKLATARAGLDALAIIAGRVQDMKTRRTRRRKVTAARKSVERAIDHLQPVP